MTPTASAPDASPERLAPAAAPPPDANTTDELAEFARVVAHDFSGPLRAIRGFASLLGDTVGPRADDQERGYITEIVTAAERMQAVNDGLVRCVRARSSKLVLSAVSLDSVVAQCLEDLGPRILDQRASIIVSPLPVVTADARAMHVVLHQLLDNALRYAVPTPAPVIHVSATRAGAEWTIVVRDNGPGIAEASRQRVLVMFKRLQPERDPACPGIGLTLCATLVQRHGGRLWLDGADGGGTAACLTLPAERDSSEPGSAASTPASGRTEAGALGLTLRSNATLAAIVESSDDAIMSKDLEGRIVTWNRAAQTLYGYSAGEAIGRHVSILMPPGRMRELPELMDGVRAGTQLHLETVRMRKDGRLIDVALTVSPIRDPDGAVVGASVIGRDVTERRRVDDQLRAFLEVAPDAIVVIDRAGSINAVNTQAETIFGHTREEMVGRPLEMLLPQRYRGTHVAHRLAFSAEPTRRPMGSGLELFGLRRDGTEFPVDIQLSSLATKEGTLPVAAIRDVTERRRLEHLRDDFIGNAAHELRTPLTTLAGLGETLARSFDVMARTDIEDAFAAMARQGERARVLIANLLDLSNVDGGRVDFSMADVELTALVERVLEAAPAPAGKSVSVAVPGGLRVHADSARLEQVLSNLLVNAYRYGGSAIRVEAELHASRVIVSVADDGAGVAPEFVGKLFEPFTRGRDANVVRGSGIGLALCRRVVQGMDGEIAYENVAPHGASFRVNLGCRP